MSTNLAARAAVAPPLADGHYQERILRNLKFQEFVRSRSSFGWAITTVMLVIYYGFILLVTFDKPLLAQKVGNGPTSLGIVMGLGVLVSAFLLATSSGRTALSIRSRV